MKRYVDGLGYVDVIVASRKDLPRNATYFGCDLLNDEIRRDFINNPDKYSADELMIYYITPDTDDVFAVKESDF